MSHEAVKNGGISVNPECEKASAIPVHDREQVLASNLQGATERLSIVSEQRTLCALMLAEQICRREDTLDVLFSEFLKSAGSPDEVSRAMFCRAYVQSRAKEESLRPERLFGVAELPPAGAHGKIAFVRNRYNERAYDAFSAMIKNAKPLYVSDFSEACEAVFNGQCSHCILPVENGTGGRLFGFYSMMDRYELKICALAELEGDEATESVRYALVGRSLPRTLARTQCCMLEFSLTREDGSHLSALLAATEALGASVHKIDFLPLEYDHSFYRVYFSVRLSLADASALGTYLSLCYPNYTPIGFYAIAKH